MSTDIAVIDAPPREFTETELLALEAKSIFIADQPTLDRMGQIATIAAQKIAEIEEYHRKPKADAFAAHKAWTTQEGRLRTPWENLRNFAARAIGNWQAAERERQRQEQLRLEREAEERQRQENLAAAVLLEDQGVPDEEVMAVADAVPVPVRIFAPPVAVMPANISGRETWSAEVTDLMALVKGVAEGRVPLSALQADMPNLNAFARAMKTTMNYPGVRAVSTQGIATRRK